MKIYLQMSNLFKLTLLLVALNNAQLIGQTSARIVSYDIFNETFFIPINDTVNIKKSDINGIVVLNDTSNVRAVSATVFTINPVTLEEVSQNVISTEVNLLNVRNDNSIVGFYAEDKKIYFVFRSLSDISIQYVRFKLINSSNQVLESISKKVIPQNN